MKVFTGNFLVLLALVLFPTGCATNWDSKIGTCTYDEVARCWSHQTVTAPDSKKLLSNGNLEVKWFEVDCPNMVFTSGGGGAPEKGALGHYETFLFGTNMILKAHHADRHMGVWRAQADLH
jgi:hypothetical protein